MGKALNWYIIDKTVLHTRIHTHTQDKNKDLHCFNWDCEPEKDTKYEEMFEILKNNINDRFTWLNYLKVESKLDKICPVCLWYYEHYHEKLKIVLDNRTIGHSYSNPILGSDWFIDNLYLGKDCRDYDREHGSVRTIDIIDIEYVYIKLNDLGIPKRESDKEAYEETLDILEWTKTWLEDPNVSIIFFGEY